MLQRIKNTVALLKFVLLWEGRVEQIIVWLFLLDLKIFQATLEDEEFGKRYFNFTAI